MRFTDIGIKNLRPKDKKYYTRANLGSSKNGFAICVYPSGVKTWFFIYSFDGKRYSKSLGNYPDVSLSLATEEFDKYWSLYKAGKNPVLIDREEREERRKAPTVSDLADEYLKKHARKKKKSWEADQRALDKEVIPLWGDRKAKDIGKRDVVLLLEKVDERGSPVMANRLRALVQKMFNFAVERDILEYNPCSGVRPLYEEKPRERALSEDEIKIFWMNLEKPEIIMCDEIKRALKLVLVTAQRPGEVMSMHTSEIDERWWTIPSAKAKNGRAHRVYLTDTALKLIGNMKGKGYIFKTPMTDKDQPIDTKAMACALRRNIKGQIYRKKVKKKTVKVLPANPNRLGVEHFSPHDLRRTATSLMAQCGVLYEHRERLLNHKMGKMDSTYNQYDFDVEKKAALEKLERKVLSIVGGRKGKVIPFSKSSKLENAR